MIDFETRLKHGLDQDDEAFLNDLEQSGLFAQIGPVFNGPLGGWTIYAVVMSLVMFGVGVWALIEMLNAETVRLTVLWFALMSSMLLSVGLIKIWFWLRMNHLALLKQLKLIELRLVRD
ncbi:MAG: hypothetical protein QNI84_09640 [Henriciella sp.]|nr:hypothetical protein [Henriciella sp.]